jgi:putative addiction module component (TIGR02574 family)
MKPKQIKHEVEQLDLSRKLMLVEEIWDSFAENNSELPMSIWQKKVLDKRYDAYEKGELSLYSFDDIRENTKKLLNEV